MTDLPELKSLILQLITKVDSGHAELRYEIDQLKQGQAELQQGQVELRQDVAELKRDVGDLKRVTSSNHFVVTGRLDEQRGMLMDHIAKPHEHAHPR